MGCDIHMMAEVLKGGKWQAVGEIFPNPYYDSTRPTEEPDEDGYVSNAKYVDEPYGHRNYNLFAILANVRNGRGFAGIKTGEGFTPIAMPRGIPADASDGYKAECKRWAGDAHSHSYHTLKELLAFDWQGQETRHTGVVTPAEFANFEKHGKPPGWSGEVSGRMVRHISHEAMRKLIEAEPELLNEKAWLAKDGCSYHTRVDWVESYASSVGEEWFKALGRLKELGSPDKVRIVFFFDN